MTASATPSPMGSPAVQPDVDETPAVHSLRSILERLAPGTQLRDGLDRIVRSGNGALIVLGDTESVTAICDGGFEFDVHFLASRLRELSKMDGAIVLSPDGSRIRRANVQLIPASTWPTKESGTRHRSAERTALQTGAPVIAVSESQKTITVYTDGVSHVLEEPTAIVNRANQALGIMERYRDNLDKAMQRLHFSELRRYVTINDVIHLIQRIEMLKRVGESIDNDVLELGKEAKQIQVQLIELRGDNDLQRVYTISDYLVADGVPSEEEVSKALTAISQLDDKELMNPVEIVRILGLPPTDETLTEHVVPRGYSALSQIPRVQKFLMDKLIATFGHLDALLEASIDDFSAIEGVGLPWARHIADGLARLPR